MTTHDQKKEQPTALVYGAAGFIGHHLVRRLKHEGYFVRGVDRVKCPYGLEADSFMIGDLRDLKFAASCLDWTGYPRKGRFDEAYQCAAEMGGMGYIGNAANDAAIMLSSSQINLNVITTMGYYPQSVGRLLFTSSACVYPDRTFDDEYQGFNEDDAYPACPDSNYGWEKLYAERMYLALRHSAALATSGGPLVRIVRLHNVYGPEGTWTGGREKLPAALCRKIAMLPPEGGDIEVWGDGQARRSFLYIDEAIEGITRVMRSEFAEPINVGSDQGISVDGLAYVIATVASKPVRIKHVPGPIGVKHRNSDNTRLQNLIGFRPSTDLIMGLTSTYEWIAEQVKGAPDSVRAFREGTAQAVQQDGLSRTMFFNPQPTAMVDEPPEL